MSAFDQDEPNTSSYTQFSGFYHNHLNLTIHRESHIQSANYGVHDENIKSMQHDDDSAFHPMRGPYSMATPSYGTLGEAPLSGDTMQDLTLSDTRSHAASSIFTSPEIYIPMDPSNNKGNQFSPDEISLVVPNSVRDNQPQYLPSATDGIATSRSSGGSDRISPALPSPTLGVTGLNNPTTFLVSVGGGSWKCKECSKVFRRKQRAEIHYLNKHCGVRLSCNGACGVPRCDKTFAAQEGLDMHLNPAETKCPSCGKTLLRKNVVRHRRAHCHPT